MRVHEFGELTLDSDGVWHRPCSCGWEVTGRDLVDVTAGRVIHLRRVAIDEAILAPPASQGETP